MQRAAFPIKGSEAAHQAADNVDHEQGKGNRACQREPHGSRRVARPDQHNDISQNAPAGDVIHRGAGNGHGSKAALQHIALAQDASQHRECRDAHGRAHKKAEAGEGNTVVGKPGIW